ncbi:antiholin-like murein hydrolase modulator LrgA [Streptococcus parauberis]|uniref:Antiholin-like protein LrgA n=1 Tax=Streptococcus parauberis NCFD 2020 TaxID=873447 RepID=F1YZ22_9STRE|nr:antiholin-like murein hydrolase modulator LrgA [Streptococcus parauberis]EGE53778.1 antiholin-like protein LrgA [Streptococcus parauberis NCFD 2020]
MKKTYTTIYQSVLIGTIVLMSKLIEHALPFVMPASVIGLVLMFLALSLNVIKLEQVEKVGDGLVNNIGLFFVPAGVSVINSLGLLQKHFLSDIFLIFASTLILLVSTGWMTQLVMQLEPSHFFKSSKKTTDATSMASQKFYAK